MYFWHSEGWTLRNEALLEAVLKQARTTRPPVVAWVANMGPEDFEKSLWFQREMMHVFVPERCIHVQVEKAQKMCGSKETYDYVVASGSFRGKILHMEVVEDFESRPHKEVSFVVRRS